MYWNLLLPPPFLNLNSLSLYRQDIFLFWPLKIRSFSKISIFSVAKTALLKVLVSFYQAYVKPIMLGSSQISASKPRAWKNTATTQTLVSSQWQRQETTLERRKSDNWGLKRAKNFLCNKLIARQNSKLSPRQKFGKKILRNARPRASCLRKTEPLIWQSKPIMAKRSSLKSSSHRLEVSCQAWMSYFSYIYFKSSYETCLPNIWVPFRLRNRTGRSYHS